MPTGGPWCLSRCGSIMLRYNITYNQANAGRDGRRARGPERSAEQGDKVADAWSQLRRAVLVQRSNDIQMRTGPDPHPTNSIIRRAHYRKPLAAAVALNSAIFVVEAAAGFAADSLSLVMDSVHNLSDELALVLLYLAFDLAPSAALGDLFNSAGLVLIDQRPAAVAGGRAFCIRLLQGERPLKPLTDGPPLRTSRRNMPLYTLSTSGRVIVVLLARRLGACIRFYLLGTGMSQKVHGTPPCECR